jgi:hypothetical protein
MLKNSKYDKITPFYTHVYTNFMLEYVIPMTTDAVLYS